MMLQVHKLMRQMMEDHVNIRLQELLRMVRCQCCMPTHGKSNWNLQLLQYEPSLRPTFHEIQEFDFFRGLWVAFRPNTSLVAHLSLQKLE